MFSARVRVFGVLTCLGLGFSLLAPLQAQEEKAEQEALNKRKTLELLDKARDEYRIYFKRPENALEFWSAIKFEMDLGKFDLAALHLKLLLAKEPPEEVDKDLVRLEQAEGMSTFLRLKQIREWSDHPPFQKEAVANVDSLIDRVTRGVEKYLSDPARIKKFINQLVAPTEEERSFAFVQLARSRERAVPYMVEGLRVHYGKPLYTRLREVMERIGPETVPVYLEVFKAANEKDFRDLELRLTLLDIVQKRDDTRVVPYLWHLSSSKNYPVAVRARAKEVLGGLLRIDVKELPPAKEILTRLADRYYRHKIAFLEGKPVQVWPWNGESIALKPVELTPPQAEEYFGLRYAREALDLDPSYQPAQAVLLSLMLERQYQGKVDQFLLEPMPPKLHELLTTIDSDLALRVLDRAMDDRQVPIILPLIQALGERGEYRGVLLSANGQPRGIVRGLYYPDRRVQFVAMKAMLRMPSSTISATSATRLVELSRRYMSSDANPKALVALLPANQEVAVRKTIKDLGYEPVLARQASDVFEKGKIAADVDLVLVHKGSSDADFAFFYGALRKDIDLGGLPTVVIVEKNREKAVRKLTAQDPNVLVMTEDHLPGGDDLKLLLEKHTKNVQFARLKPAERKEMARVSLDTLWRMARGEISGYNVAPALDSIIDQLRNPEQATLALEILGRLPGKEVQYHLMGIVTDRNRDKKMRLPALIELNRHIQTNGVQLDKKQIEELRTVSREAGEDPAMRAQLNITSSMIDRSTAGRTGAQLFQFRPDPVGAPPAEKEKEAKKDDQ